MTAGLACGQELVVESFTATADPMVVSLQRRDFNNQLCALVKVQIPRHGLIFEGDVVGETSYSAGEYMVYLCPGAKMFQIRGDDFYPARIKFDDYGVTSLNGGIIYAMRLKVSGGGVSDTKTPKGPGANYLVLKITPATGVSLKIDGQPQQVDASGNARVFLKYGSHSYTVEADGYAPASETVNITSAGKVMRDVVLKSVRASLTVVPETKNCEIYINEELRGTDTWAGELSAGLYRYEVRRPGFESRIGTIELAANDKRTLVVPALEPHIATLNVDCQPVGAEIYIDGNPVGTSPEISAVTAGYHLVTIQADGYKPRVIAMDFVKDETYTISEALEKDSASSMDWVAGLKPVVFRTTPKAFDLAVSKGGELFYITPSDWASQPKAEKNKYNRRGLVLGDGNEMFCLFHFGVKGTRTYKSSYNLYENSMLTEAEYDYIAKNYSRIQSALDSVGISFDDDYYWIQGGKRLKFGSKTSATKSDEAGNRQVLARWKSGETLHVKDFFPRVSWSEYNLAVRRKNKNYYFDVSEWNELSPSEQAVYSKTGIVLRNPDGTGYFCLALEDDTSAGQFYDWSSAMQLAGYLPKEKEADYIAKNINKINDSLEAFGGKKLKTGTESTPWYWTRDEVANDSAKAGVMILGNGPNKNVNLSIGTGTGKKTDRYRVRKVSY